MQRGVLVHGVFEADAEQRVRVGGRRPLHADAAFSVLQHLLVDGAAEVFAVVAK